MFDNGTDLRYRSNVVESSSSSSPSFFLGFSELTQITYNKKYCKIIRFVSIAYRIMPNHTRTTNFKIVLFFSSFPSLYVLDAKTHGKLVKLIFYFFFFNIFSYCFCSATSNRLCTFRSRQFQPKLKFVLGRTKSFLSFVVCFVLKCARYR